VQWFSVSESPFQRRKIWNESPHEGILSDPSSREQFMRVRNKEIRQRRHRKLQKIKESIKEAIANKDEKKASAPKAAKPAAKKAPKKAEA